jgi:hypothetical protein
VRVLPVLDGVEDASWETQGEEEPEPCIGGHANGR